MSPRLEMLKWLQGMSLLPRSFLVATEMAAHFEGLKWLQFYLLNSERMWTVGEEVRSKSKNYQQTRSTTYGENDVHGKGANTHELNSLLL
jgi:hypothetical protein